MGKIKYKNKIIELFDKSPVVDAKSISRIISKKSYPKQLIRNLVLKEDIHRITKGYYSIHDDPSLLVYCFKPSYLGLQDALSFHNIWEQESIPIVITSRRIRQGIRKIEGSNVLIRRLKKEYLFGFEYFKFNDYYLPYSDIEKTFIDMVYFKQHLSSEVMNELKKRIVKKKLYSYLSKYPSLFQNKVKSIFLNNSK